jgi:SAM-dependent methyltransferase
VSQGGGAAGDPPGGPGVGQHWFEPLAEHAGAAYLRYSFTKGTLPEVEFLVTALGLRPGLRVLDVGCGPGRHAHELARRGMTVVGVDISRRFVDLATAGAPSGASFRRGDARSLPFDREFDAVISLCQGGFGLLGGSGEDGEVLAGMVRALRPGGVGAVSAFSAYFQVRWLEETDTFDAATGVNHERSLVKNERGEEAEFDLWTTCFTPRELRLMVAGAGATVSALWSVGPGDYAARPPDLEHPEWLVVFRRLE